MSWVVDTAVKIAGKSGMDTLIQWGGIGTGVGATWGAVSDNETVVSGAFKGLTLGGMGSVAAKYGATRYIDGMNKRAAAFSEANLSGSFDSIVKGSFNNIADYGDYKAFKKFGETFSGLSGENLSAGTVGKGWWSGTSHLDSATTDLIEKFGTMNKNFSDHLDSSAQTVFKDFYTGYSFKDGSSFSVGGSVYNSENLWKDARKSINNRVTEVNKGLSNKSLGLIKDVN